jgi:hypothetical protein
MYLEERLCFDRFIMLVFDALPYVVNKGNRYIFDIIYPDIAIMGWHTCPSQDYLLEI